MLRVWWIPQVPMNPFYVPVKTVDEAALLLNTLADYDLFQLANHIKPDYSNAGGLEELDENGEWYEYYDEDGYDIDDIMKEERDGV
jgi:hypothetical protein